MGFLKKSAEYAIWCGFYCIKWKIIYNCGALICGMSQEDGIGAVTAKVADCILLQ